MSLTGGESLHGKTVKGYNDCKDKGLPFLIGVADGSVAFQEIEARLCQDGQKYYRSIQEWEEAIGIRTYERDFVAYSHIGTNYIGRRKHICSRIHTTIPFLFSTSSDISL